MEQQALLEKFNLVILKKKTIKFMRFITTRNHSCKGVKWIKCDLRDESKVSNLIKDKQIVIKQQPQHLVQKI